ncbi:MAG: hypothetical protein NTV51_13895 [Verrucomicrobia bacterium]|nr:hypothetical protein [Verrucomicrobiota bacterium]
MDAGEANVEVPKRSRWLRWTGIAVVLVLVAGAGVVVRQGWPVPGLAYLSPRGRHMLVLARLNERITPTYVAFRARHGFGPDAWKDPEVCVQGATLRAMQMSLYNTFYHGDRTPPTSARLRAIADRLDADDGEDLKTPDGCRRLFALFEEASPAFKSYGPTLAVYELRDDGSIRTLQPKETPRLKPN